MSQSPTLSFVEALANVVVGFVTAVLTQFAVFPAAGLDVGLRTQLTIGAVFTCVSLLRSYLLRRVFNAFLDARRGD